MDSHDQNILLELPPEKSQKIEIYQEILSILSTISETTIDSSFSLLDSLKILDNEIYIAFIARKIAIFCEIFPFHINLYSQLASMINSSNLHFKDLFLSQLFHRYYFANYNCESNFALSTIYCCIKYKIYTSGEIITQFKEIFRQKYQYTTCNTLFYIYFSPELKENDKDFYEELGEYVTTKIDGPLGISEELKKYFLNDFQKKLYLKNFELLKKYRDDMHLSENPLFEVIYHDDVNKLRSILANPNRNENEVIIHSVISPYREIANNLSLISTAAVFSSVECFKYLLLNGSKTDDVSSEMGTLAQDTIVGGNIEIIRFAQQNRVDFGGALTTCAFYFKNEIFEWIFDTIGNDVCELTEISPAGSTVFCQACRIGNIEILLKCIEYGVDLNAGDINSHPLSQAVLGGSDEVVEILLDLGLKQSQKSDEKETKQSSSNSTNQRNLNLATENNQNNSNSKVENNQNNSNSKVENNQNNSNSEVENNQNNSNVVTENNQNNSNSDVENKADLENDDNSSSDKDNDGLVVINKTVFNDFGVIDFDEVGISSFEQIFPLLNIHSKIKTDEICHAMREAVSGGQIDCIKCFFDHGLVSDISLILSAIINSRYSTLAYLFETVDFEIDDKNDIFIIIMNEKSQENKKSYKVVYNKNTLVYHLLSFISQQNDLRITNLIFKKLKLNFGNIKKTKFVLMLLFTYSFEMVDTFGLLFGQLDVNEKIMILGLVSEDQFMNILKRSKYSNDIKQFCVDYEMNNDVSKINPKIQSFLEMVKKMI